MQGSTPYDYIVAGGGLAGRSLLSHAMWAGALKGKRVLMVDKEEKQANDHTWCFWETGAGPFEPLVHHRWEHLHFHDGNAGWLLQLAPLQYKMLRADDFYQYTDTLLRTSRSIEMVKGTISDITPEGCAMIDGEPVKARYIFSSIPAQTSHLPKTYHYFLQHFKGWMIETPMNLFDTGKATLMDFRVSQQHGPAFFYVLPVAPDKALVEYTLFSPSTLNETDYDDALHYYITHHLQCSHYKVLEQEFGVIPMTDQPFASHNGNIIYIGGAAGQIKGSTGYAFQNIQRHSAALASLLLREQPPHVPRSGQRFRLYDSVMLQVLASGKLPGREVFSRMFDRNSTGKVFRFLDNQTRFSEELGIFASLPKRAFLQAAAKTFSRLYL